MLNHSGTMQEYVIENQTPVRDLHANPRSAIPTPAL